MVTDRYAIQKKLKSVGEEGQEKIRKASVVIVGLGGLGSSSSLYLTAAGIGKLLLIDGDQIEISNLHRQVLYGEKDVGYPKARVAYERLRQINSEIEIQWKQESLEPSSLDRHLKDFQYIVDGTDQLEIRFWLNHYCAGRDKIYVYGSCDSWSGQAALLTGPCLSCLFPNVESGLFQDCETRGVLGPTVGLIGQLQAQLVLNHILFGKGEDVLHLYNGAEINFEKVKLQKNSRCLMCQENKIPSSDLDVKTDRVSLSSLAEWRQKGVRFQLVDIRAEEMFKRGALCDSLHIPYATILGDEELHLDRAIPIVLVCHRNLRSPLARAVLKRKGYKRVYLLERWDHC